MEVDILPDPVALAESAADRIALALAGAVEERGRAMIALSGGATPTPTYRLLAGRADVDWRRVDLCQVDERCVPPDHEHSNWRMIRETIVGPAGVALGNLHRMAGEKNPPDAAADYEAEMRALFAGRPPAFDVAVLGIGDDGHIASLFPGSPALFDSERWVIHTEAPESSPVRDRLTLTLPVLNASHLALFIVAGASKAEAVARALAGDPATPAALVRPAGRLLWMLDQDAADRPAMS